MSFLSEKDIPISLFPPADDELEADEAIGALKAYAFITQREDQDSFDIHRLVQLAMRNWLDERGEQQERALEVIERMAEVFPQPAHGNKKEWMRSLPHMQAALKFLETKPGDKMILSLRARLSDSFVILGKYREAEQVLRRILELTEKAQGRSHRDTASCLNRLALVLDYLENYKEAEQMQREVIELRETLLGKEHPETLVSPPCSSPGNRAPTRVCALSWLYHGGFSLVLSRVGSRDPARVPCFLPRSLG